MTKKEKSQIKSMEAICKMLDHCSIPYSGLTIYLQGMTHCDRRPCAGGAVLISANGYPRAEITKIDGKKWSHPIALGQ